MAKVKATGDSAGLTQEEMERLDEERELPETEPSETPQNTSPEKRALILTGAGSFSATDVPVVKKGERITTTAETADLLIKTGLFTEAD